MNFWAEIINFQEAKRANIIWSPGAYIVDFFVSCYSVFFGG